MSKTKKCVRCSADYDYKFEPEIWITIDNHSYPETTYDFCPECQDELKKWIKNEI